MQRKTSDARAMRLRAPAERRQAAAEAQNLKSVAVERAVIVVGNVAGDDRKPRLAGGVRGRLSWVLPSFGRPHARCKRCFRARGWAEIWILRGMALPGRCSTLMRWISRPVATGYRTHGSALGWHGQPFRRGLGAP
jgi:hypothetical protein